MLFRKEVTVYRPRFFHLFGHDRAVANAKVDLALADVAMRAKASDGAFEVALTTSTADRSLMCLLYSHFSPS